LLQKHQWNEFFVVPDFLQGSRLHVYNRWGALVYYNEKYASDWNGGDLVSGTYFYTIANNCLDRVIKGTLSIVR